MVLGVINLGESIAQAFVGILLLIDGFIFGFIDKCYQLFMALASARILTDETIQAFANRVYIIVGVATLFVLAYSILTAIVNPDNIAKGDNSPSKILQNVLIALLFLALTPAAFNFLYKIQDVAMRQNVIGNLILGGFIEDDATLTGGSISYGNTGTNGSTGSTGSFSAGSVTVNKSLGAYEVAGRTVAFELFSPFLQPNGDPNNIKVKTADYFFNPSTKTASLWVCGGSLLAGAAMEFFTAGGATPFVVGLAAVSCGYGAVATVENAVSDIFTGKEMTFQEARVYALASGDFGVFSAFSSKVVEGEIDYTFIISTIVGVIALYVFISFCLDLGVRAAKLAYFQMIAPLPIVMKILPKSGKVFDTWLKKTLHTFLEVFIRILIIYFVVYLVCNLPDFTNNFWVNPGTNQQVTMSDGIQLFAKVFIILGLIIFAKQAPKLISEMFGIDGGSLKLGIREKLADAGVMRGAAAIGAGVQTAVNNWNNQKGWRRFTSAVGGLGSGAARGFNGAKDAKTFSAMNKARADAVANATARREQRKERRNYLNSMTDKDGNEMSWLGARVANAGDSIRSWAGLGPSTAEYETYDKIQKQEKSIKEATEKLFAKYDKKAFLENMNGKFKGDDDGRIQGLWEKYISASGYGMSYGEAEAQLKQMQARDVSSLSEAEQVEHARDVKAMESMLAQLKKKSLIKLENEIYSSRNRSDLSGTILANMDVGEVREVAAKVDVFAEEFKRSGITTDVDGNTIAFDPRAAGKSSDDIATAMGNRKTKIAQEIERQKRREAATKGGK